MRQGALVAFMNLVLVAPLALLLLLSLTRYWIFPDLVPAEWQFEQWRQLLTGDLGLIQAALRSLIMASGVALGSTALALPTSHVLFRHRRGGILLTLAHLPFAASPVVFGVGLLYLFLRLHLSNSVPGVMLSQFLFAFPYAIILMSTFWNPEAEALAGLAATLGARPMQVWWRVLIPRALPLLMVCIFQTFLISWFDYALVLLIGGGLVDTLTIRLFQYFDGGDIRLAATCALLLMAPPLLGLAFNRRLLSSGVSFRGYGNDS